MIRKLFMMVRVVKKLSFCGPVDLVLSSDIFGCALSVEFVFEKNLKILFCQLLR